jgi:peroxiredoxin family protein
MFDLTDETPVENKQQKFAMVVAASSFDKAMMPFMMATTGAAMGMDVHIFFTFFGLKLLKKGFRPKLPGLMAPFTGYMRGLMRKKKVPQFEELIDQARDLGVHLYGCSTSMDLMSLPKEKLIDGIEVVGAAAFLDIAADSDVQLFIS